MNHHPRGIGAVMVLGGGIAGIQASLDLSSLGYHVYLVERGASIGGVMAQLDKTFPTNDCAIWILAPKLVEAGRSPNIEILTRAELVSLEGEAGDFRAGILLHPRYVDEERCTGCGTCSSYCPVPLPDRYNEGLSFTRAIHKDYQQAVPSAYWVDETACLFLTRKECKQCERVCLAGAIDFKQQPRLVDLPVGAVILAAGFGRIDQKVLARYGYGLSPDVMTGVAFERLTSASGPTMGEILRPSDRTHPKRIAFLQCIGSRDLPSGNGYCSSVCCMYAIKEAMVAKDHHPDLEIAIFFMDMRTQGKEFDYAWIRAKQMGIRFIRSRVGEVRLKKGRLEIFYVTEAGARKQEPFDLVVLPEGLESPQGARSLAKAAGVDLNHYDFARTSLFSPLETTRKGIFVAGAFQGPKDVPDSVTDASGGAALVSEILNEARHTQITVKTYPEEEPIDEEPRIGVFVCFCGSNIGGVIDVKKVAEYTASLEHVVFTDTNLYSCAQNTQVLICDKIKANRLNRVVVAACSPRTHEPLFQETLKNAGLNRCLFEMANIRDHCSWVHALQPGEATEKAKDLVRMAVNKARFLWPLPEQSLAVIPRALVVGGGLAGMTAALSVAEQGFECFLVESSRHLGGNLLRLRALLDEGDPGVYLAQIKNMVLSHPLIQVFTEATIQGITGYVGNFRTTLRLGQSHRSLEHGVVVVATGGKPYQPAQYGYGLSPGILTQMELEERLEDGNAMKDVRSLIMIQCVGSRGEDLSYCSKVCCGQAVKNALRVLALSPTTKITVLYRDMRTYGLMEDAYQEARERGVAFVRFKKDFPPVVRRDGEGWLVVEFLDPILQETVTLKPDVLVLSVGIVPNDTSSLSKALKLPVTRDGFFLEAHPKLRPVEFSVEGVYLCGLAHSPKPVAETVSQAKAAAAKACIPLAKGHVTVEPIVSYVDQETCIGCGLCEALCPYAAIRMKKVEKRRKAETLSASCKGCGICAARCPTFAISMGGFTNQQILAQVRAFGMLQDE